MLVSCREQTDNQVHVCLSCASFRWGLAWHRPCQQRNSPIDRPRSVNIKDSQSHPIAALFSKQHSTAQHLLDLSASHFLTHNYLYLSQLVQKAINPPEIQLTHSLQATPCDASYALLLLVLLIAVLAKWPLPITTPKLAPKLACQATMAHTVLSFMVSYATLRPFRFQCSACTQLLTISNDRHTGMTTWKS